jgi:hypothetical protein
MQPVEIDSSRKRTMSNVALLSPETFDFARGRRPGLSIKNVPHNSL